MRKVWKSTLLISDVIWKMRWKKLVSIMLNLQFDWLIKELKPNGCFINFDDINQSGYSNLFWSHKPVDDI